MCLFYKGRSSENNEHKRANTAHEKTPEGSPIHIKDRCPDCTHIAFLRIFFVVLFCQTYPYILHKVKKISKFGSTFISWAWNGRWLQRTQQTLAKAGCFKVFSLNVKTTTTLPHIKSLHAHFSGEIHSSYLSYPLSLKYGLWFTKTLKRLSLKRNVSFQTYLGSWRAGKRSLFLPDIYILAKLHVWIVFLVQSVLLNIVISCHPCHHSAQGGGKHLHVPMKCNSWEVLKLGAPHMLNDTPFPPLAGILPRKSHKAEAGTWVKRAAVLGGTIPRQELLLLPLCWFPSLTAMYPAWLLGNLLLEPSHLSFFLGNWISYKTSSTTF